MANVAKVALRLSIRRSSALDAEPVIGDIVNTFHVHASDAHAVISASNREDIAEAFDRWWDTPGPGAIDFKDFYGADVKLERITVMNVEPALSLPFEQVATNPGPTPFVASIWPPQLAVCVELETSRHDRRGRGRCYLLRPRGVPDTDSNTGYLVEPFRDTIAKTFGTLVDYVASVPGGPFALCVYSRVEHTARSVNGFRIRDRIATQRRRAVLPVTYRVYDENGEPIG